jgi:hypothetical protein
VDQNIKGHWESLTFTDTLFAAGPRDAFSDDVETLVRRWLYTLRRMEVPRCRELL